MSNDNDKTVAARAAATYLLTAKDRLTAGAYEEMLKKNGVAALLEQCEPSGRYGASMGAVSMAGASPVNLYVQPGQLERARELVDYFDNHPVVFNTPPPKLNSKSRSSQLIFAFVIFVIFVIPIGISLFIIGQRVMRAFIP